MDIMDVDLEHNLQYVHCLYMYVSVKSRNERVYEGWLKTIDPLTGNIILVAFEDDSTEMDHIILVMRQTYEDVTVVKKDPSLKAALQKLYAGDTTHLETDVIGRKERLMSWIKKQRLPFRETNDGKALVICENVTIHPPYNADSCCSSNGRMLLKIRQLVDSLPDETPNTAESEVKMEASENNERSDS